MGLIEFSREFRQNEPTFNDSMGIILSFSANRWQGSVFTSLKFVPNQFNSTSAPRRPTPFRSNRRLWPRTLNFDTHLVNQEPGSHYLVIKYGLVRQPVLIENFRTTTIKKLPVNHNGYGAARKARARNTAAL